MNDMKITVEDIVNTPELRTRVIAGKAGIKNIVQWAHVCEMPNPTEWLGTHDLLMSTGLGIPSNSEEQRQYILRLVDAKIAGLMIGENMNAPSQLENLLNTANESNFPVLMTHYGVPFAAVTKMIMNSRHQFEFERNRAIAKLYEFAQHGLKHKNTQELIKKLNKVLGVEIYLIDIKSNVSIFGESVCLPDNINMKIDELKKISFNDYTLVKKIKLDEADSLYIISTSFYDCKLVIKSNELDYSLIHHISAILSIDLEHKNFEFERKLRIGSELIHDIFEKKITNYQIESQLEQFGIKIESAVLIVLELKNNLNFEAFLFLNDIHVILRRHYDQYIFIVNNYEIDRLIKIMNKAGVSRPLEYCDRFIIAVQEAKLSYKHCTKENPVQYYINIVNSIPWLPNDINEAKQIYERYLGILVEHDRSQGTSHIKTLQYFLDYNCSWEKTAKMLNIHKQTLVYRMQKIQSLIGRNLNETEDIVIVWTAMKCLQIFNK